MAKRKWLLAGLLVVLFIAGIVARSAFLRTSRPAYTLTSQATQYDPDGTARPLFVETMFVSSSGNWHSVKQYATGARLETFATVGQGVVNRRNDEARLNFLSSYDSPKPLLNEEGFRKSANFLRVDTVLGYPAFIMKAENSPEVEFYCSPVIGGENIKIVHRDATKTVVIEPVSLVFGNPDPSSVTVPTGLPTNYDNFNKVHAQR